MASSDSAWALVQIENKNNMHMLLSSLLLRLIIMPAYPLSRKISTEMSANAQ